MAKLQHIMLMFTRMLTMMHACNSSQDACAPAVIRRIRKHKVSGQVTPDGGIEISNGRHDRAIGLDLHFSLVDHFADGGHGNDTHTNQISEFIVIAEKWPVALPPSQRATLASLLALGRVTCEGATWINLKFSRGFGNSKNIILAAVFHVIGIIFERVFLVFFTLSFAWGAFTGTELVGIFIWGLVMEGEKISVGGTCAIALGTAGIVALHLSESGIDHTFTINSYAIFCSGLFAITSCVMFPLAWNLNSSRVLLSRSCLTYLGLVTASCFEVLTCILLVNGEIAPAIVCGLGFTGAGVAIMGDHAPLSWAFSIVTVLEYLTVEGLAIFLFNEELNLQAKVSLAAIMISAMMLCQKPSSESNTEQPLAGASIESHAEHSTVGVSAIDGK